MGTPQGSYSGSIRNPTPRLSDRKKSLFSCDSDDNAKDPLYGIKPLDGKILNYFGTFKNILLRSQENQTFRNAENHILDTPTRRSTRLQNKQLSENINKTKNAKGIHDNLSINKYTGIPEHDEKHLHKLFSTYLNISGNQSVNSSSTSITLRNNENSNTSKNTLSKAESVAKKRELVNFNVHDDSLTDTSKRKKVDNTCKPEPIHIPTKTFYSSKAKLNTSPNKKKSIVSFPNNSLLRNRRPGRRMPVINMRKTVRHMIRRPARLSGGMNHSSYTTEVQVDRILSNVRNDKLRELIESKRRERAQIQKLHEIIRNSEDPIKMARPLSALSGGSDTNNNYKGGDKRTLDVWDLDFSDVENSNSDISYTDRKPEKESIYQQVGPLSSELIDDPPIERKFFKSGRSTATCKEIKITDNIKAVVHNGKISLQNKKNPRRQITARKSIDNDFCNEQEIVSEILKNLDDTTTSDDKQSDNQVIEEPSIKISKNYNEGDLHNKSALPLLNFDFKDFRNRIPYNTNDPELIEQQHLLLDFLITNNICTEQNFNIFIVDPENHKEDAARIVDEIIVLVDEYAEFRKRIPNRTSDPDIIAYQQQCLDFLITHNCCTEDYFDKFIVSFDSRRNEVQNIVDKICNCTPQCLPFKISNSNKITDRDTANKDQEQLSAVDVEMQYGALNSIPTSNDEITKSNESSEKLFPIFNSNQYHPLIKKSSRRVNSWLRGYGFDQYQIDAGQKDFGAQQCKQCGLVYSIHEAEEEKLHRDYHASLHLLRFKAWIDEDAVAFYREWGADGRIIRITETSYNKKLERLKDVLKVVDKELGFSSYIIPKIFVAYLAIRRQQIVGLCLVQPLERAHKFICINEIDCCTEETFEARCGISRIWVSPLHRRFGIGSKLIQAVQLNTIVGKEIPLHEIAFSAPTESGKVFAQKIYGTSNFLVYQ